MAPAPSATCGAHAPNFRVDGLSGPRRPGLTQPLEHAQNSQPLPFAQPVAPCRVLGHRVAYDLTLGGAKAGRRAANLGNGGFVQGKGHANHNDEILP